MVISTEAEGEVEKSIKNLIAPGDTSILLFDF